MDESCCEEHDVHCPAIRTIAIIHKYRGANVTGSLGAFSAFTACYDGSRDERRNVIWAVDVIKRWTAN